MITRLLHSAVNAFQQLRRAGWFVTRPAHGVTAYSIGKVA
jgi:hypothetical protein